MPMRCSDAVIRDLAALRADGVSIAGDDFGAGYSNFARMKEIPLDRIGEHIAFPLVVKPVQGGASLGVRAVEHVDDLASAVMSAFQYHSAALLEHKVMGTEVAVSGSRSGHRHRATSASSTVAKTGGRGAAQTPTR